MPQLGVRSPRVETPERPPHWDDGDLFSRNAAGHDLAAEAFANGGQMIARRNA